MGMREGLAVHCGPMHSIQVPSRYLSSVLVVSDTTGTSTPRPAGNILPRLVHRTVSTAELKPGRLVIVGDVHGCVLELRALLSKIAFKEGEDNLVFAGDLVNKGPASVEVQ